MHHVLASIGIGVAIGVHFDADRDSDPDADSVSEALRYHLYFRNRKDDPPGIGSIPQAPSSKEKILPVFDYRMTRALVALMAASTSLRVAMEVSPGVVIARAPCAAPYSTASCGLFPCRNA